MIREGNTRQIRMQITRSTTAVAAFLHPSRRHPVFHTSEDVVPEPSISLLGSLLCYRATKRQSWCNPDVRGKSKHENKIHVRPRVNIRLPHRLDFEFRWLECERLQRNDEMHELINSRRRPVSFNHASRIVLRGSGCNKKSKCRSSYMLKTGFQGLEHHQTRKTST